MSMLLCKDIINERSSQFFLLLCPLVLTVQSILAAVYRIDLSGTPCMHIILTMILCVKKFPSFFCVKTFVFGEIFFSHVQ